MMVHYSGFNLTKEQVQKLLTYALDQVLAELPEKKTPKAAAKPRASTRPPMSKAERLAISRRMKASWKKRRAAMAAT